MCIRKELNILYYVYVIEHYFFYQRLVVYEVKKRTEVDPRKEVSWRPPEWTAQPHLAAKKK